ncbi:MAG: replication-relaxation family protein [Anaerolineae bacterium]|nr:replication-relaxation family protein [Anaerolineae bacterium]
MTEGRDDTKARRRRRRDQRLKHPPPMQLTGRDKQVIEAVYQYRVLRQDQVQKLFFGSKSTAQSRLARLYDHGFLERQFLLVRGGIMNSPIVYLLDRKGAELLRAECGYEDVRWHGRGKTLSSDFMDHALAINDFRIAVELASRRLGYQVVTWLGETELKADYDRVSLRSATGRQRMVSLIPDSYFVVDTPHGKAHFFLEVDRGTMPLKRFRTKVQAYLAYYRSGGYERRYGTRSLRILVVGLGEGRLASLSTVTESAGGKRRFWFGLLSALDAERVLDQSVWSVAGEERHMALIEPA